MREFIDATIFLGMQSIDEEVRIACKNYFVQRYKESVVGMSDDQAGRCDKVIWKYARDVQDSYYPFMDRLRTDMNVQCLEYEPEDVAIAQSEHRFVGLKTSQKLTLGMAIARQGHLYTLETDFHNLNSSLASNKKLPIFSPTWCEEEQAFPDKVLEKCYQESLVLRIDSELLGYSSKLQSFISIN
jgi:Family of unknown function (DUF6190)